MLNGRQSILTKESSVKDLADERRCSGRHVAAEFKLVERFSSTVMV